MAFEVSDIVKNGNVEGWYFLLDEDIGDRKHVKVTCNNNKVKDGRMSAINTPLTPRSRASSCNGRDIKVRNVNGALKNINELVNMTLKRDYKGYGLTLKGCSAVTIAKVKPLSAAQRCGLQEGDSFEKINNIPVNKMSLEEVTHILEQCQGQVEVTVLRPLGEKAMHMKYGKNLCTIDPMQVIDKYFEDCEQCYEEETSYHNETLLF
jgi:hypothetical protein